MRSTRALLATLGTSISLVAAGVAALFAVSAFVAFHGWPGIRDGGRTTTPGLVLRTAAPAASPAVNLIPAGRAIVLGARASSKPAARSGTRSAREHSTPVTPDTPVAPVGGTTPAPTAATPAPTAPATSAPADPGPATPQAQPSDPVRDTVGTVTKGARDLTGAAGQALTPVSPDVGATVQQAGQAVANTVDGVANSLLPAAKP